jgi:hypothetical protein
MYRIKLLFERTPHHLKYTLLFEKNIQHLKSQNFQLFFTFIKDLIFLTLFPSICS